MCVGAPRLPACVCVSVLARAIVVVVLVLCCVVLLAEFKYTHTRTNTHKLIEYNKEMHRNNGHKTSLGTLCHLNHHRRLQLETSCVL